MFGKQKNKNKEGANLDEYQISPYIQLHNRVQKRNTQDASGGGGGGGCADAARGSHRFTGYRETL